MKANQNPFSRFLQDTVQAAVQGVVQVATAIVLPVTQPRQISQSSNSSQDDQDDQPNVAYLGRFLMALSRKKYTILRAATSTLVSGGTPYLRDMYNAAAGFDNMSLFDIDDSATFLLRMSEMSRFLRELPQGIILDELKPLLYAICCKKSEDGSWYPRERDDMVVKVAAKVFKHLLAGDPGFRIVDRAFDASERRPFFSDVELYWLFEQLKNVSADDVVMFCHVFDSVYEVERGAQQEESTVKKLYDRYLKGVFDEFGTYKPYDSAEVSYRKIEELEDVPAVVPDDFKRGLLSLIEIVIDPDVTDAMLRHAFDAVKAIFVQSLLERSCFENISGIPDQNVRDLDNYTKNAHDVRILDIRLNDKKQKQRIKILHHIVEAKRIGCNISASPVLLDHVFGFFAEKPQFLVKISRDANAKGALLSLTQYMDLELGKESESKLALIYNLRTKLVDPLLRAFLNRVAEGSADDTVREALMHLHAIFQDMMGYRPEVGVVQVDAEHGFKRLDTQVLPSVISLLNSAGDKRLYVHLHRLVAFLGVPMNAHSPAGLEEDLSAVLEGGFDNLLEYFREEHRIQGSENSCYQHIINLLNPILVADGTDRVDLESRFCLMLSSLGSQYVARYREMTDDDRIAMLQEINTLMLINKDNWVKVIGGLHEAKLPEHVLKLSFPESSSPRYRHFVETLSNFPAAQNQLKDLLDISDEDTYEGWYADIVSLIFEMSGDQRYAIWLRFSNLCALLTADKSSAANSGEVNYHELLPLLEKALGEDSSVFSPITLFRDESVQGCLEKILCKEADEAGQEDKVYSPVQILKIVKQSLDLLYKMMKIHGDEFLDENRVFLLSNVLSKYSPDLAAQDIKSLLHVCKSSEAVAALQSCIDTVLPKSMAQVALEKSPVDFNTRVTAQILKVLQYASLDSITQKLLAYSHDEAISVKKMIDIANTVIAVWLDNKYRLVCKEINVLRHDESIPEVVNTYFKSKQLAGDWYENIRKLINEVLKADDNVLIESCHALKKIIPLVDRVLENHTRKNVPEQRLLMQDMRLAISIWTESDYDDIRDRVNIWRKHDVTRNLVKEMVVRSLSEYVPEDCCQQARDYFAQLVDVFLGIDDEDFFTMCLDLSALYMEDFSSSFNQEEDVFYSVFWVSLLDKLKNVSDVAFQLIEDKKYQGLRLALLTNFVVRDAHVPDSVAPEVASVLNDVASYAFKATGRAGFLKLIASGGSWIRWMDIAEGVIRPSADMAYASKALKSSWKMLEKKGGSDVLGPFLVKHARLPKSVAGYIASVVSKPANLRWYTAIFQTLVAIASLPLAIFYKDHKLRLLRNIKTITKNSWYMLMNPLQILSMISHVLTCSVYALYSLKNVSWGRAIGAPFRKLLSMLSSMKRLSFMAWLGLTSAVSATGACMLAGVVSPAVLVGTLITYLYYTPWLIF
ncbi:MAG: hypothetical protein VXZ73_02025, partial [Pseudomonadota bacterium]|nr:hypothetical protein [Pseudomonadota bacterium]